MNGQSTQWMSHQQATDMIKNQGNAVTLNVQRSANGMPLSPPMSPQQPSFSPTGSCASAGSLYKPSHLCSTNKGIFFKIILFIINKKTL